jgi:hypothetical protein
MPPVFWAKAMLPADIAKTTAPAAAAARSLRVISFASLFI